MPQRRDHYTGQFVGDPSLPPRVPIQPLCDVLVRQGYISPQDLARRLGVSPYRVYSLILRGILPAAHIRSVSGRVYRVLIRPEDTRLIAETFFHPDRPTRTAYRLQPLQFPLTHARLLLDLPGLLPKEFFAGSGEAD